MNPVIYAAELAQLLDLLSRLNYPNELVQELCRLYQVEDKS